MGVKSNNIIHTHPYKLLQREGTVKRLAAAPFMLPALVQEWHYDIEPPSLPPNSCNDSLKILEMVIRGHVVNMSC